MSSRIVRPEGAFLVPKRKPAKDAEYLAFLHELPCVVTRRREQIQACHVSFAAPDLGHYGRGKGRKAPDRWALPMTATEHAMQHSMGESAYWDIVCLNPHLIGLVLWGLFTEAGMDATMEATQVIMGGLRFARTF